MDLRNKCLDIFYKNIIEEAKSGRVDSYFMYNMIFNTKIGDDAYLEAISPCEGLLIPTLNIKMVEEFNYLLVEYVKRSLEFYGDECFPSEILNDNMYESKGISKEKTIMTLLFANATIDDFDNVNDFLRKRINFFEQTESMKKELGFSENLNANLRIEIKKDIINNETPYQFNLEAYSSDGDCYMFPSIKFGISDNKVYVYAVQNSATNINSLLTKKINRKLYKVGEGFNAKEDNYEIFSDGNLKDITPSFLVVINVFVSYFYQIGITDLVISSILLERWNSKKIANNLRYQKGFIDKDKFEELESEQDRIQDNLTQKLLRSFMRLAYHYPGINVNSYPFDKDSNLHITVDNLNNCNNYLLTDTSALVSNEVYKKI